MLREWQADPAAVGSGGSAAALAGWKRLRMLVGYDAEAGKDFREGVADPILAIEVLIRDANTQSARSTGGRR